MEFGPKRGHILYIFENFFKDFSLLIAALIIGFLQGDMEFVVENIGVLIVVLFGPVSRIVQYLTTYYQIDHEKLLVKSGVFNKKNLEVPISTITTVDFSQNVLHQIFGAYRLNIDNASNMSALNTKINMTFGKEDAFAVRELLIRGRNGLDGFNLAAEESFAGGEKEAQSENEAACGAVSDRQVRSAKGNRIKIKSQDLILMGLLKSKGTFFVELVAVFFSVMAAFNLSDAVGQAFAEELLLLRHLNAFVIVLIVCGILFAVAIVCGMAGALIRYYGFEMMDNGEAVKIEYGLFTKKRYTIAKNRVSGFSYQQSFLMRCFGTGTLQLYAIGYGQGEGSSGEEPILFPLIQKEKIRDAMAEILPEMKEISSYTGAAKGSLPYFFLGPGFACAIVFFCITAGISIYAAGWEDIRIAGLLAMMYSIAGRIQQYKNSGIYANDSNISLSYGGFQKNTVFVKTTHVESTSVKAGRRKAKKGIGNVAISYIAPLASARKTAKNVPLTCFEEVKEKLVY